MCCIRVQEKGLVLYQGTEEGYCAVSGYRRRVLCCIRIHEKGIVLYQDTGEGSCAVLKTKKHAQKQKRLVL